MRMVIFVDNGGKNRQIKKTIIMMMIIRKSHKPMIGCLHVGQLDNLGLQLEHTGWPERHCRWRWRLSRNLRKKKQETNKT